MKTYFETVRVANNFDAMHCLPITLMGIVATLTGRSMTLGEAEGAAGFQEGRETWAFKTMLWLCRNGYEVWYQDDFDVDAFMADPLQDYAAEEHGDRAAYIESISDFSVVIEDLQACLAQPYFRHDVSRPSIASIGAGLTDGWLPAIRLDAGVLARSSVSSYESHILLATGLDESTIRLQDSGPPAKWDLDVSHEQLLAAMAFPRDDSGNVMFVRHRADPK